MQSRHLAVFTAAILFMNGCGSHEGPTAGATPEQGGPAVPASKQGGGTHSAKTTFPTANAIYGSIIFKTQGKDLFVAAGCLGQRAKDLECAWVGDKLGGTFASSTSCTTFAPHISTLDWNPESGATFQHTRREPGHYLVFVSGRAGSAFDSPKLLYDWKWVELTREKSTAKIDLIVDPEALGRAEVSVDNAAKVVFVSCVPLNSLGKVPLTGMMQNFLQDLNVTLKEGKAVYAGLPAGNYRFYSLQGSVDAEVKRGQTVQIKLPASKSEIEGHSLRWQKNPGFRVARTYL